MRLRHHRRIHKQKIKNHLSLRRTRNKRPIHSLYGGNKALFHINVDNNSKRHLLLIKDSYANSLIPFLIPQFNSITVIDARYYFEDYKRLIKDDLITDVLFMNNANTFVQDTSLADMLEAN